MKNKIERGFLAGVGLLSMSYEKAQKIVDELVERGEIQRDEAKEWVDKLVKHGDEERQSMRELIQSEVSQAVGKLGLATKKDVKDLSAKIDALSQHEES
jgi:polyhydroxyalkanoate synthesis regulator phasin